MSNHSHTAAPRRVGTLARGAAAISVAAAGTVAFLAVPAHAAGGFTSGDLVVYRVGTGSAALSSASTAVTLDEFLPGTAGQAAPAFSLPMPTTTGSGTTPNPLTASGSATSEGGLTLSTDGTTLLVPGYDSAPGTAGIASTADTADPREVAEVGSAGDINTTTTLGNTATSAFSGNNPRGATSVNGSAIWVGGAGGTEATEGGVWYTTEGSNTATQLIGGNFRWANIFNQQLYSSSGSATSPAIIGVNQIGTGLPTTTGQTDTNLNGVDSTSSGSPYSYYLLSEGGNGIDTAYVADSGVGIEKYSLIGGTWTAEGSVALSGATGLTGTASGTTVTLYATNPGSLVQITDSTSTGTLTGAPVVTLASASTNEAFRGVAFAPTAIVPPPTTTTVPTTTSPHTSHHHGPHHHGPHHHGPHHHGPLDHDDHVTFGRTGA